MAHALLLGTAQDAGLPQAGCYCPNCVNARADPSARGLATSLGLIDPAQNAGWLIDATPDFREQMHLLQRAAPECALRGILLTHAHMGHYLGLAHLGREAMNIHELPVYVTPSVSAFLQQNGPWSQLVNQRNIALCAIQPGERFWLTSGLSVLPVAVPHRAEYSDTLAYVISGPTRSLFYCPDIDRWELWDRDLAQFLQSISIALLDGTFFSGDELPGRNMAAIPHPPVKETAARLAGSPCEIVFIHLNHSNPLWRASSEREWLEGQGMKVGQQGMLWELG